MQPRLENYGLPITQQIIYCHKERSWSFSIFAQTLFNKQDIKAEEWLPQKLNAVIAVVAFWALFDDQVLNACL